MSISIEWGIVTMERTVPSGIVEILHYSAIASDGIRRSFAYGSFPLASPASSIVPYEQITKEDALEWLFGQLPQSDRLSIENSLLASIQEQKHPTKAGGLPWAS